MEELCSPRIFRSDTEDSKKALQDFLALHTDVEVIDRILPQLEDYVKSQRPSEKLSEDDLASLVTEYLAGSRLEAYGSWVYYPWSRRMIHLLEEEAFAALRTDRNKSKITAEEQRSLSTKKIGLIGLSVGHAAATTLALERGFGELRIADHDHLDLSNLNRIRSGVHNIGVKKTSIVSREIAELDPYLKVTCYDEGITEDNLREFLTADGGLDLLIDECDSLDIKLRCREMARELGIPVIMETSDRGMLDVERFDLEPDRPLLNGLVKDLRAEDLKSLSKEEMIAQVMRIIDIDASSDRLKESMAEIGKTISTWPQLGSSVMLGGANAAFVARKILLGEQVDSGRYYMDMERVIQDTIMNSNRSDIRLQTKKDDKRA